MNFYHAMNRYNVFLFIGFCLVAFFSLSDLTESPPTWMDEGIITQVSRNISEYNIHGIQVAPDKLVSTGFVSTGYPVTFPISVVYEIFGTGIFQARLVMVFFIFSLVMLVYFFIRKTVSCEIAVISVLLLVSFGPLYGHGKNVLGEIPGLVYLFASAIAFAYIETHRSQSSVLYVVAGLSLGLAVVCKPIFILLIPAISIALVLYRKDMQVTRVTGVFFLSGLIVPVAIWLYVQFNGDSFSSMFQVYANPHNNDIVLSIFSNLKRFVTEGQPLYALIIFSFWFLALVKRLKEKTTIHFSEFFLFLFSILVLLAYLRTVGYYRYFFLAEFIALAYLPQSLTVLFSERISKRYLYVGFVCLFVFQLYQTQFNSFISEYRISTRSHDLALFGQTIPANQTIFIYQAPEMVNFLKNNNYYQYMEVTTTIHVGEEERGIISRGLVDRIFVNNDIYESKKSFFVRYAKEKQVDRYIVLSLIK